MRNFIMFFVAFLSATCLSSCGVNTHLVSNQNLSQTQVLLQNEKFRVLGEASGTARATYIIGIGGLSQKAIMNNAVADMYRQANLSGPQTIVNINVHSHVGGVFPFYYRVTYVASGQIVEFSGTNNGGYENKETPTAKKEKNSYDAIYKVGDIYKVGVREIGIVVDVSADGKHGKIIYYGYQTRKWSNKNDVTGANNSYDGAYNCKILSVLGIKDYPAAALSGNRWYLPSAKELALVFENIESINASLTSLGWYTIDSNQKYWTSTETSANEAITIANKAFVITNKDERANVIVMSTF